MHFQLFVEKCLICMLLNKRSIRSNHKSFINNEISKAIMTRSWLKNCFLQNRSAENRKLFCKQRNKCVSLLRKSEKDYFANLYEKNITDNKRSWKTAKPFLSRKIHPSELINITEGENNSLFTNCARSCKRTE